MKGVVEGSIECMITFVLYILECHYESGTGLNPLRQHYVKS